MWGFLVLLLGMVFHTRASSQSRKSKKHRKFYRTGLMTEELQALDALNDGLEMNERYERRHKN